MLAEFASVVDAVNCAVSIQQALAKANAGRSDDSRMDMRIGVNVGDVMVKDGSIFGDGVNVAARVESIAEPGGICVTRGVRDHLRDRIEFEFEDLGEHTVKNIARPVRVFRVLFDPFGEAKPIPAADDKPAAEKVTSETDEGVEVAFWQSVEAANDPAEYRAYLKRFPNGAFATLASKRIQEPPTPSAERLVEIEFWNSVKESEEPEVVDAYVQKYPDGEFVELARLRLQALEAGVSRKAQQSKTTTRPPK